MSFAAYYRKHPVEIMDEKVTKPTIETILERMIGMEERLNQRTDGVEGRINFRMSEMEDRLNQRMDGVEERLNPRMDGVEERLGVRLDRIESVGSTTRGEMLDLRADFRELRTQ